MDEKSRKIVKILREDLPIVEKPFKKLAESYNLEEEELINTILNFMREGIIRHFGAIVKHDKVGYISNAMVAWEVKEEEIDRVGNLIASFPEVTHCYKRVSTDKWPYNLYAMIHGKSKEEFEEIIKKITELIKAEKYTVLFSLKEFKKDTMKYF